MPYYNASYALDGFDVALIRLIGQKLGVQVDVQDYAFDGLSSALQIGQINVAIAAISVTPERQQQLGFSSIYYSGQEGMLAGQNSAINSIPSVDALAPYRVGVQAGSVYETWLRTSLVDSGKNAGCEPVGLPADRRRLDRCAGRAHRCGRAGPAARSGFPQAGRA